MIGKVKQQHKQRARDTWDDILQILSLDSEVRSDDEQARLMRWMENDAHLAYWLEMNLNALEDLGAHSDQPVDNPEGLEEALDGAPLDAVDDGAPLEDLDGAPIFGPFAEYYGRSTSDDEDEDTNEPAAVPEPPPPAKSRPLKRAAPAIAVAAPAASVATSSVAASAAASSSAAPALVSAASGSASSAAVAPAAVAAPVSSPGCGSAFFQPYGPFPFQMFQQAPGTTQPALPVPLPGPPALPTSHLWYVVQKPWKQAGHTGADPWCIMCQKWAAPQHLQSSRHAKNLRWFCEAKNAQQRADLIAFGRTTSGPRTSSTGPTTSRCSSAKWRPGNGEPFSDCELRLLSPIAKSHSLNANLQKKTLRGWTGFLHGGNTVPSVPLSAKPIHAGKNWLWELIWAYLTEGAPKKMFWGINLGIGS